MSDDRTGGASPRLPNSLVGVSGWPRILLGSLLIGAVAIGGIALNFTLLGLTQDQHDPVGKLSPRTVFSAKPSAVPTTPGITTPSTTGGGADSAPGGDGDSDSDSDD